MNTQTRESRKKQALEDYKKVLRIEEKKPLQVHLALKWLRQAYDNRVLTIKNESGLKADEAVVEIHGLSKNLIQEVGAISKAILAGEFDTHGGDS